MAERIFKDTSDYYAIDCGDHIQVGPKRYLITGHERERRFGIEDPKYWVKRAQDTETGERKIIKLSYFESFTLTLGGVSIRCFRDPDKEGELLELVRGNPYFMQGRSYRDTNQNNIRVLDIVRGPNLFFHIDALYMNHRRYFESQVPRILNNLIAAFQAIAFLHQNGYRHGDIRSDHLIIEKQTGRYVWIDFDYDFEAMESPFSLDLFGIGNILLYTAGKGFHTLYQIKHDRHQYTDLIDRIDAGDFSILDKGRLVNLKKLYPYIPDRLNNILMHFSGTTGIFYESTQEIIADLNACLASDF